MLSPCNAEQGIQFYSSGFARLRAIRPIHGDRFNALTIAKAKVGPRVASRKVAGIGVDPSPLRRQTARLYGDACSGAEARAIDFNFQPVAARQLVEQQA